MPRYTAKHAAMAVHLFLLDQGLDEPIETCPLKCWAVDGPNRFVYRDGMDGAEEIWCTVEFDDNYRASVFLSHFGRGDVSIAGLR
jgi:hypothetical protein